MRALLLLAAVASPAAWAGDDEFLLLDGDGAPEETRHRWTWPERAHFDSAEAQLRLSWPSGTGDPEESVYLDDVIRLERARPFEAWADELFALLADGRRVLVARGPDVSAQASIASAVTGLPIKEMPPGQGHFEAQAGHAPPQIVVGGGGGIEIRPVDRTEIAGSANTSRSAELELTDDDPNLRGEGDGTLEKHAIDLVLKQKMGLIRQCYTRELRRDPDLRGKMVIRFVIASSGRVKYAAVRGSNLGNAVVEECVLEEVRSARFPEPQGGSVVVSYPFQFSGG